MTQMQPDAPENGLVDNEGVNAGSDDDLLAGPEGDVRSGGEPGDFDPAAEPGDETQAAGELAGAAGRVGTDPSLEDSGQDAGLMDRG